MILYANYPCGKLQEPTNRPSRALDLLRTRQDSVLSGVSSAPIELQRSVARGKRRSSL